MEFPSIPQSPHFPFFNIAKKLTAIINFSRCYLKQPLLMQNTVPQNTGIRSLCWDIVGKCFPFRRVTTWWKHHHKISTRHKEDKHRHGLVDRQLLYHINKIVLFPELWIPSYIKKQGTVLSFSQFQIVAL